MPFVEELMTYQQLPEEMQDIIDNEESSLELFLVDEPVLLLKPRNIRRREMDIIDFERYRNGRHQYTQASGSQRSRSDRNPKASQRTRVEQERTSFFVKRVVTQNCNGVSVRPFRLSHPILAELEVEQYGREWLQENCAAKTERLLSVP